MSMFSHRSQKPETQPASPVIESLEGRAYLSAPDLIVTVPGPLRTSAVSGVTVNEKIAVDIANNGPGTLRGPLTLTLYASTDQTVSEDDAQLIVHNLPRSFAIRQGTHRKLILNVKAYPQNLDNNYFILGQITPQDVVGASSTTIQVLPPNIDFNNTAVLPATGTGHVGHTLAVRVHVTNDGNVIAKGNLFVNFGESINTDGSSPVNLGTLSKHIHLLPHKSTVLFFHVPLPLGTGTGNQFIVADINPADFFNESNLVNNINVSGSPVSIS